MINKSYPYKHLFIILSALLMWVFIMLIVVSNDCTLLIKGLQIFAVVLVIVLAYFIYTFYMETSVIKQKCDDLQKQVNSYKDTLQQLQFKSVSGEQELKQEVDISQHIQTIKTTGKSLEQYTQQVLMEIARIVQGVVAVFYVRTPNVFEFTATSTYAFPEDYIIEPFNTTDHIGGQAVISKSVIVVDEVPETYMQSMSGLGGALPKTIYFIPAIIDNDCVGLLEIAVFCKLSACEITNVQSALCSVASELRQSFSISKLL